MFHQTTPWMILGVVIAAGGFPAVAQDTLNGTYAGTCSMSYSKGGTDKTPKIRFTVNGNTVQNANYAAFKGAGTVKDGVVEFSVSDDKNNVRVLTLDLAKGTGTARGLGSANTQSGACTFAKAK